MFMYPLFVKGCAKSKRELSRICLSKFRCVFLFWNEILHIESYMYAKTRMNIYRSSTHPFLSSFNHHKKQFMREKNGRIGRESCWVFQKRAGYDGMYILQSAREQCQAGWLVNGCFLVPLIGGIGTI